MTAPSYEAQMAFSSDAAGYFILGRATLGNAKLLGQFSNSGFTSLQTRFMGFRTYRGREDEYAGINAGTIEADFDDDDGALDTDNAASAYYPNVRLMKRLRVAITHLGTEYPIGYGFANDYRAEPVAIGATVGVHATDLFTRLAREGEDVSYPEQRSGARLNAILNELEWPTDLRAIDDGILTLPAAVIGKSTTKLSHIDSVMKAELGTYFVGGSGAPTFHDRHRRYMQTSRGTFGAGGLKIRRILTSFNDAGLLNRVSVTRSGGVEQVAQDTASVVEYDVRGYSLDSTAANFLPSDPNALEWATTLKNRRAQPRQRVVGVELDPGDDDTIWGHVLDAEIGDMITLSHDVPGTKGLTATDFFIESIRHEWSLLGNPPHLCTWGLSKVSSYAPFLLGRALLGRNYLAY